MSTKVTTIFEALRDLLEETFPEHKRLPAENLEENTTQDLRQGYELRIGGAKQDRRQLCPEYFLKRAFVVTFTRECIAKDGDVKRRDDVKLALLEDLHLLLSATVNNLTLDGTSVNFDFEDDDGPQELPTDDGASVFTMPVTVSVEYSQSVGG